MTYHDYPGARPGTPEYEGQANGVSLLLRTAWPECQGTMPRSGWSCSDIERVLRRESAELRGTPGWRWRVRRRLQFRRHLTLVKGVHHLEAHLPDGNRPGAFANIVGDN